MKQTIIKFSLAALLLAAMGQTACRKDFTNPAAATEAEVYSSAKGLTGVAIGLQRLYSSGRAGAVYNVVTATGFVTRELVILNVGNVGEAQLNTGGGSVDGTNSILANIWSVSNKIIYDADKVIAGANNLSDRNYASGLIGYVSIFKALAIGNMSMYWEKVPTGIGSNVSFMDRNDGYGRAIAVLDNAINGITANPISASFTSAIPAGTDILPTLYALKARYALFKGDLAAAASAANLVDLSKKSTMNYDGVNLNPIFETATSTNNVYQPVDSTLGLPVGIQPAPDDKRIPFYIAINATIAPRHRIGGFGLASTTPFPYYLPGEITLIKAEVLARQSDLPNALIELNKVVTKTPATDPLGVGGGMPALAGPLTQAQLLEQIYRNRCIELFMSGLKLEDMRRFGRPLAERKRNFMPYPFRERDNNPNTPPDPAF